MDILSSELGQFIHLQSTNSTSNQGSSILCSEQTHTSESEYTHWPRNMTLRLIEEYKQHYKGTFRSIKKMFEVIAVTINQTFGTTLTGAQVNNKFKSLERAYKNFVDNNNKTGRSRRIFEYEKEMEVIFGKKQNINPVVLISESTIVDIPHSLQQGAEEKLENMTVQTTLNEKNFESTNNKKENRKRKNKTRTNILELIRDDRLKYQKEQLLIAKEKLALEQETLKQRKRKNYLSEERNNLLKDYVKNGK